MLGGMALATTLAMMGCGSDSGTTGTPDAPVSQSDAPPTGGFTQPAGTVAVNFTVDDTANHVYGAGDLQWKGSHVFDEASRKITSNDSSWAGPWPTLYDDGPWDKDATPGHPGHEPKGAVAGDHKWGVTVFVTPPATASVTYEYGLNDNVYQTNYGNGWVWVGTNGSYTVAAGATAPITAAGLTFPAFGTTDLRLTVHLDQLDTSTTWDTSKVGVKGSGWAWGVQDLTPTIDNTAHTATFVLSNYVGSGKPFNHTGLLASTQKPEFIFVFGTGSGVEYKGANTDALATGITAEVKPSGGSFSSVAISIYDHASGGNGNTYITVP
jgi:hypothetical protein